MKALSWLGRCFPDDESGRSAYGDLLEEHRARTSDRRRAGFGFWWKALRLAVGYGLWARFRSRNPRHRREKHRSQRRSRADGTWLRTLRVTVRSLAREPMFTAVSVISIAVGIGGATVALGVADALLFQPAPGINEPDRVVEIGRTRNGEGFDTFSYPDLADLRVSASQLEEVAAWHFTELSLAQDGHGERVFGMAVSSNYFQALMASPTLGRTFLAGEDEGVGTNRVAVISHALWTRQLASDPNVVGSVLRINREPYIVVGVMDGEFHGHQAGIRSDVWIPLSQSGELRDDPEQLESRTSVWLSAIGRLAPDATVEDAEAAARGVFSRLATTFPSTNARHSVRVIPLGPISGVLRGVTVGFVGLLSGLVLLVLVATCTNVAGMLIARTAAKERMIAIRLALGAGTGRVIHHQMIESLVVFGIGGAGGVLFARFAMSAVDIARIPFPIPLALDFTPDYRALAIGWGVALLTGLLFGLAPALHASKVDVATILKRTGSGGRSRDGMLRRLFVGSQVSVAALVLIVAALFLRSLERASAVQTGFDAAGVYMTTLDMSLEGLAIEDQGRALQREVVERLIATPGVASAALATDLPLDLTSSGTGVWREGIDIDYDSYIGVDINRVSPGYFATLRIPLVQGRMFDGSDLATSPPVVVVSRTFAEQLYPEESALGKRIRFGLANERFFTIVGVVEDVKNQLLTESAKPFVYISLEQRFRPRFNVLAQLDDRGVNPGNVLTSAIHDVDPSLSITPVVSVTDVTSIGTIPQKVGAAVGLFLGVVGLFLATLGVYGIVAYSVSRRRHEMGIRMALGANQQRVVSEVLAWSLHLIVPGVVIALLVALTIGPVIRGFLIEITPLDPTSMASAALIVAAAALGAAFLPAWRASRMDPSTVLRSE